METNHKPTIRTTEYTMKEREHWGADPTGHYRTISGALREIALLEIPGKENQELDDRVRQIFGERKKWHLPKETFNFCETRSFDYLLPNDVSVHLELSLAEEEVLSLVTIKSMFRDEQEYVVDMLKEHGDVMYTRKG